ncbi:antibiotic biosynthesis monooxygenase [Dactylosporangium sp. NPDC005555]|uniref:putative quinol monooxygenase n=1 Tax=Dactylosporangium sp. NPDC005555 TaxID=3154889 RepID=UPI0033A553B6
MFALVVRFDLKDAPSAAAFDALVALTGEGIRTTEPGTLVYATHTVHDEPLARVFYELYRDREAFEEHERRPHVRHFLEQRDQYVASTRVEFLNPAPSKGID